MFFLLLEEDEKKIRSVFVDGMQQMLSSIDDVLKMMTDIRGVLNAMFVFAEDTLNGTWTTIKDTLSGIWTSIKDLLGGIWTSIKDLFGGLQNSMSGIGDSLGGLGGLLTGGLGGGLLGGLLGGGGKIGGFWANGGAFGIGGVHAFAAGGAFTNGIYSSPTPFMFANGAGFSAGVMGEAGDEAVMPLRRGPDGRLGVSMHGGGDVAAEVRALRDEVAMLRADNRAGQVAIATSTQKTYKLMDRWNGEGMPEVREALKWRRKLQKRHCRGSDERKDGQIREKARGSEAVTI